MYILVYNNEMFTYKFHYIKNQNITYRLRRQWIQRKYLYHSQVSKKCWTEVTYDSDFRPNLASAEKRYEIIIKNKEEVRNRSAVSWSAQCQERPTHPPPPPSPTVGTHYQARLRRSHAHAHSHIFLPTGCHTTPTGTSTSDGTYQLRNSLQHCNVCIMR